MNLSLAIIYLFKNTLCAYATFTWEHTILTISACDNVKHLGDPQYFALKDSTVAPVIVNLCVHL